MLRSQEGETRASLAASRKDVCEASCGKTDERALQLEQRRQNDEAKQGATTLRLDMPACSSWPRVSSPSLLQSGPLAVCKGVGPKTVQLKLDSGIAQQQRESSHASYTPLSSEKREIALNPYDSQGFNMDNPSPWLLTRWIGRLANERFRLHQDRLTSSDTQPAPFGLDIWAFRWRDGWCRQEASPCSLQGTSSKLQTSPVNRLALRWTSTVCWRAWWQQSHH